MKHFSHALALLLATLVLPSLTAQDRVLLKNGDSLTGTIKTLEGGNLTLSHPDVGDIVIKFENVTGLQTAAAVTIVTRHGDQLRRQVTGIKDGALVLAPAPGLAISDVARADVTAINPPPSEKPRWTGSVNLGTSVSTGNTDRRSAAAGAEAIRRTEADRITVKSAWNYADEKTGGAPRNRTERRLEGSLQYDYFLGPKSYVLTTASAAADEQADLDLRFTGGAGAGYQWIEDADLSFSTEAGATYFSENFGAAQDTSTIAARVAYHLKWQAAPGIEILQDVSCFPSLEEADDLFVTKDSRARFALTDSMFAQLQWVLDYDTTPAAGLRRADNRYFLTVGWTF